jgi:hypothetical protein
MIDSEIKIFDNFLDIDYFENLKKYIYSIPWYFSNTVVDENDSNDKYQFVHVLHVNTPSTNVFVSKHFNILHNCISKINPFSLIRIKANLLPRTDTHILHGFHTDFDLPYEGLKSKTSILYINTNNGYTLFENHMKVKSVENRLVTFDSQLPHTGTTCTDQKVRIVINFNYF